MTRFMLSWFFGGMFGLHELYIRRYDWLFVKLVTANFLCIGWIVDGFYLDRNFKSFLLQLDLESVRQARDLNGGAFKTGFRDNQGQLLQQIASDAVLHQIVGTTRPGK